MTLSSSQQRTLTWLGLAVAAALLLWLLGSALAPLILALVFAYLLWPLVRMLERRGLPRALATTFTVLFAMLALAALALLLVPIESVSAGAWNLVPLKSREGLARFLGECDSMLRQYLKGQLSVMVAMALVYPLGLMLTGLNLAWPIGVFTGLAVFIPYLGYTTGLVLALMSAAIQFTGWHGLAEVAVVYAVGQVLESFVLTPRLVGERIGLSPLAVILALLVFGELFGFVGVLVCLPVTALGVVALRHAMDAYRASTFYRT